MKQNMIWAFLIHLSRHMWEDPSSPPLGMCLDKPWTDNNNTDIEVWDKVVSQLPKYGINMLVIDVGDGIKYDSHPEIAAPDAWSKEFLRQKLQEIRDLGMEPIPKLNFSAAHDAWLKEYGRMVSTPTYYQVCADLIQEVCEVFDHPRLFHVGLDEEYAHNQQNLEFAVIRHRALWEHDAQFLFDQCEKNGARPWFWSAFAMREHREFVEKQLSRKVLMSAGWYKPLLPKEERVDNPADISNPEYLDEMDKLGFEQVAMCSTKGYKGNTLQVLGYCKDRLSTDSLLGFLTAPWLMTEKREFHGLLHGACKLYYERQKIYPETVE